MTGTPGEMPPWRSPHLLGKRTLNENQLAAVLRAFGRPHPASCAGQALRGLASSALDLPDGLASDLSHILKASGVRAQVDLNLLPSPRVAGCGAGHGCLAAGLAEATTTSSASPCPRSITALDTALATRASGSPASVASPAGEPGIDYLQDEQPVELHQRLGSLRVMSFKDKARTDAAEP